MCERLSLFQWILGTDYKPHLIQIASIIERVSNNQMTNMDGIKRAEVQSYLQGLSS
jgi:hypothetical protein